MLNDAIPTFYLNVEGEDQLGCTNTEATNYNIDATQDDGSCYNPLCDSDWNEITGNYTDGDSDNDQVCDENEVLGCTDWNACNFAKFSTPSLKEAAGNFHPREIVHCEFLYPYTGS